MYHVNNLLQAIYSVHQYTKYSQSSTNKPQVYRFAVCVRTFYVVPCLFTVMSHIILLYITDYTDETLRRNVTLELYVDQGGTLVLEAPPSLIMIWRQSLIHTSIQRIYSRCVSIQYIYVLRVYVYGVYQSEVGLPHIKHLPLMARQQRS